MIEIQSEIDLLNHLKSCGIKVAFPAARLDESFISQFNTINGIRDGVMYTSVGVREFSEIEETFELNERLGSYIASIHNAWDKYDFGINRRDLDANLFIDSSMTAIRQFSTVYDFDIDFLEAVAKNAKKKLANLIIEKP